MSVLTGSLNRFRDVVRQVSQVIGSTGSHHHVVKTPLWHGLEPMEPRLLLSSSPLLPATLAENLAPNIILLIGDGMGPEQIEATAAYLGRALSFESFLYQGQVTTRSASSSVTDSAAAATAIATGQKVNNGVISLALPGDGSELTTSLEIHQDLQKMVGLVTTTYLTHATPAAFGAHETSRNNTGGIAADYLNQTRPNVMLGGGGNGLNPTNAGTAGYAVVTDKDGMLALDVNNLAFVSGQFGTTYMPYELDGNAGGGAYATGALPDLSEMTAVALNILDNDPDGFFLMVEGGLIDQACHSNDLQRAIGEIIEFEETVAMVRNWAQTHGNTLVIVTADHETGGLSVGRDKRVGVNPTESWSTTGHTGVNVPIYAWGPGAEAVSGILDNTDIFTLTTPSTPSSEVTVSFQQNVGGYVSAVDTQIRQATGDTSYGGAASLNVDNDEPVGSGSDAQVLLRFDNIFGSAAGQIPADKQIVSAQLQLQVTNSGNSVEFHRMLSSWLDSVTWNGLVDGIQANGVEAMVTADAITGSVATGILTIDVTTAVRAWQADPSSNHGWAILPTGSDGIDFYSAEGTAPPRLTVTYDTGTPNQAPVAADDSAVLDEDTAKQIDVLANDADADNDSLAVVSVTQGVSGSVAINPDRTVTYTPRTDFHGSDSFAYTISDGRGGYDVGAVVLTVAPVYDAPLAVPDSAVTIQGTPVTIYVLTNDMNPDESGLLLTFSEPTNGQAVIDSTEQTLIYTPDEGFVGTDSFTYTISDGQGGVSTADVVVTVNPLPQTLFAAGEISSSAVVVGNYLNTMLDDGVYESLTEVTQRKKSTLEHTWVFALTGGDAIVFHLQAWSSSGDDDFTFQYSTDRVAWTSMFTVTATADNGAEQTYSLPAGLSGNVYIRAVDTNGGANETAEDTLYVDAMWITAAGAALQTPTVAVAATDANASEEGPDSGMFTLTRSNTAGSLTVYYTLGGTAGNGVDYTAVPSAVTFSDREASRTVTIAPLEDGVIEAGGETVVLTLDENAAYDIGAGQSAVVTIADNDGETVFVDYYPTSQQTAWGAVETSTLAEYEVLAEKLDGKKSWLEHTWTFDITATGGGTATFSVEAWHDGAEDDFLFQYSLNGTDWINMLTITKTGDDNTVQTYALPGNLTGTVYVRVLDTNRAVNKKTIDRLYIDQLFVRCA